MGRQLPYLVLELHYFYISFTRFILLFCLVLYLFVGLILPVLFLQLKDLVEAYGLKPNCFNHRFKIYSFAFAVSLGTFKYLCLYDFEDRFQMDQTPNLFHLSFNLFLHHFLRIGKSLLKSILHEIEDDLNFQERFSYFL